MSSPVKFQRPAYLAAGLLVSGVLISAGFAYAQSTAASFDPAQLPGFNGVVKQYTLTPRGDIDGLILKDGTEVKLPPHLSSQIVYAVKPGDAIDIRGIKAHALALVLATSVTNDATGATVVDVGPAGPGRGQEKLVTAKVEQSLHGPRGETNGVLLDDGMTVHFPPQDAESSADLLKPGTTLSVRGLVNQTVLGSVMDARAIGLSADHMTDVASPDAGPGRLPPPPRP